MEKIDEALEAWLNSQAKTTRGQYKTHWGKFAEFTGLTGDEILVQKKAAPKDDFTWERKILEFCVWLRKEKGLAANSASTSAQAIRGFFAYHRTPLIFRKKETRKLGDTTRKTEDYRFSLADIRKMAEVGDVQEKYVLIVGKSFGLRAGDFLRLARGDLEPYIEQEPPISIGTYRTEKEKVPAYPLIDVDAKPIIKLMLEKMTREGRIEQTARMVEYSQENELSRVIRRLATKAGMNIGNKVARFHCMRKFLSDHLSSFMSESKWKQIVGKKIKEGAYVSPDTLREDYARAMPETCFSYQKSADIEKLAKKQALLAMTKAWGMSEVELKALFRKRPTTTDEEIEEMERIVAEQSKLREHIQTAAGGLNFQEKAAETIAEIFTKALEKFGAKQEKKTCA